MSVSRIAPFLVGGAAKDTLEIEVTMTLKNDLARALTRFAADIGKEPVEAMADLVEYNLQGDDDLKTMRREIKALRERLESATTLPTAIYKALADEAKARQQTPSDLAWLILKRVAQDKLYAAVLDP